MWEPKTIFFTGFGGIRLVADAFGDPAGPPALLLHGGGQTRHAWSGAAEALAQQGWYAIALDHRGHGDSQWSPDGKYNPTQFVGDVTAIVKQLDQKPVAIGASLGGLVAMMAEGLSTESILRGLVLVDIVPKMEQRGVGRIVGFMSRYPNGFETLAQAADAISEYMPDRPRPDDLSGLKKNLRQRPDGRWIWHWDPQFLNKTWEDSREMMVAIHNAPEGIKIPTLLVRGLKSDIVSDAGVEDFLKRIPHAEYVDVRDAGHMIAGDRNDVFNEAVIGFLQRQFAPA